MWNSEGTAALPDDPWWKWRWHRCRKCDVIAIPVITRWIDPTWWAWFMRYRLVDRIRDWFDDKRR